MRATSWKSGEWNALCDECGFKFKSSDLRKRWDGLMVCPDDWETRHPQDFLRPITDEYPLPWTRPDPGDTFLFVCTVVTSQGVADVGTADCARADMNFGYTTTTQSDIG